MKKLLPLVNALLVLLAAHSLRAQTLSVDVKSLIFTAPVNGPPTSLPVNVSSSPASSIIQATAVEQTDSQVSWLSMSPNGGSTPVQLAVTVDPGKLAAGVYTGSVVISILGVLSGSVTVSVSLTVSTINATPPSLTFQTAIGNTPLVQSVTLTTTQPVSFTATAATTSGGNWLAVSPTAGSLSSFGAVSAIPDPNVVPLLSPGTYNGSITITPVSGSSLPPIVIPITLTVTPAPAVTVSPASVSLSYQIGGTANTPQKTITLTTSSAQGVAFTISATSQTNPSGGTWVVPNPASGLITSTGTPVTIAYNPVTGLPAGTFTGTVTVNTPNGSPTKTDIPVTLLVSTLPLLNVSGDTLNFTYEFGTANPAPQSVTATSGTPQAYGVAASTTDGGAWLVVPTSGTTPAPLSISVNPAGLAPGTYTGTVKVTGVGTGNGAQQIPVTLKVYNDPAVVANFTSLALPYQIGQSQSVSQAITVSSSNGVPLNFAATATTTTCGTGWLPLGNDTGKTTGQVTVAVNPQGLAAGTCTGTVSIVATNALTGAAAINSPLTIPVTVTVSSSALLVVSPLTPAVFTAQAGGNS